jgi:hypothetical protein
MRALGAMATNTRYLLARADIRYLGAMTIRTKIGDILHQRVGPLRIAGGELQLVTDFFRRRRVAAGLRFHELETESCAGPLTLGEFGRRQLGNCQALGLEIGYRRGGLDEIVVDPGSGTGRVVGAGSHTGNLVHGRLEDRQEMIAKSQQLVWHGFPLEQGMAKLFYRAVGCIHVLKSDAVCTAHRI